MTATANQTNHPQQFSTYLGKLAAELSLPPTVAAAPPGSPPPTRLAAALAHFRRREHVRNEMKRSLQAHEFAAP